MTDFFFLYKINAFITSLFIIKLLKLKSKRNLKISMCFYRRGQIVWFNFVKLNCSNITLTVSPWARQNQDGNWTGSPSALGCQTHMATTMQATEWKYVIVKCCSVIIFSPYIWLQHHVYSGFFNCKASRSGMSRRRCGFYFDRCSAH